MEGGSKAAVTYRGGHHGVEFHGGHGIVYGIVARSRLYAEGSQGLFERRIFAFVGHYGKSRPEFPGLLHEPVHVASGYQHFGLESLGIFPDDIECLSADRARRSEYGDTFHRFTAGGDVFSVVFQNRSDFTYDFVDVLHSVAHTPVVHPFHDLHAHGGIDEIGGTHFHGAGAGKHEFNGVAA